MRAKYIGDQLPVNYSLDHINKDLSSPELPEKQNYNGREYQLLGTSEKKYSFADRVWIGIRAFFKTTLVLGVGAFFSQNIKDDWKAFWDGKRTVALYTSSPILAKQVLAYQGNVKEMYNLAVMYEEGRDCQQDLERAFDYYQTAADHGNLDAQRKLAQLYEHGHDAFEVPQDIPQALEYYKNLANQGDLEAQFKAGLIYLNDNGYAIKDEELGLQYLLPLAKNNHEEALFALGKFYFQGGLKIPKDNAKALTYLEPLANGGNKEAQLIVGRIYAFGLDRAYLDKARPYLEPLAKNGNQEAQRMLDFFIDS